MTIDTPENTETVEVTDPVDQTVKDNDTPTVVTLEGLAGNHLETHPGFDPARHAQNPDGSPKRKADGSYASKRGRKPGQANPLPPKESGTIKPSEKVDSVATVQEVPRISPDEAARQSANLIINASVWICGEDIGKPIDKAESEGLKISFVNYYESRGVPNIPPEIGLLAAIASYIAPRYRKSQSAQGKIKAAISWLKEKTGL